MGTNHKPDTVECWCLHGALGATSDWRGLAEAMKPHGVSIRGFDLWKILQCRAVGLSEAGGIVNRECAAISTPGRRVLLGYSMGGRLALHALLDEACGMWDAAVIVSAHPGLEREDERAARREADALWAARALQAEWQDFVHDWDAQPLLRGRKHRRDADMRSLSLRRNEVARSFVCWSLGEQMPVWERLSEITCPVLWVAGERDEKFRAIAERAVAGLPDARLWLAPECGHRVPWEDADAFAARLAGFITCDT